MQNICMVDGSTHGLFSASSIVGSSYVLVFVGICAITCVSNKGLVCGMKSWY